jgi:hypothetical protein
MFISELFEELAPDAAPIKPFDYMSYGSWRLSYTKKPTKDGNFHGFAAFLGKGGKKDSFKASEKTQEQVIHKLKSQIDTSGPTDDPSAYNGFALDLNAAFSHEYLEHMPTGTKFLKFEKREDRTFLVIPGLKYVKAFGRELSADGYRVIGARNIYKNATVAASGTTATTLLGASLTAADMHRWGLIPNGRYEVEFDHDDEYGNTYLSIIPHSRSTDGQRLQLGKPGFTVGAYVGANKGKPKNVVATESAGTEYQKYFACSTTALAKQIKTALESRDGATGLRLDGNNLFFPDKITFDHAVYHYKVKTQPGAVKILDSSTNEAVIDLKVQMKKPVTPGARGLQNVGQPKQKVVKK